ncbi:MAG TPA: LysM peptidoglycan-binding domain-containing protein [Desulfuromonadales bacterium]|nr:LysM peptidoglycan-binding domain-containing protein [Desulfuromonadales bacterium]
MYTFLRKHAVVAVCLASLVGAGGVYAMDPRFELDPKAVVSSTPSPKKATGSAAAPTTAVKEHKASRSPSHGSVYTVKQGDHLFKILMRDYGLTNDEADSFIEEIKRENNIYDIRRLKIGQRIVIPPVRRTAGGTLKTTKPRQSASNFADSTGTPESHSLRIESSFTPLSELESLVRIRETWEKIVPVKGDLQKPLSFQTSTFSLTLDPQRYPIFPAMNGGRIVLDQGGTIPPLLKALIEEKDPSIRIVSEAPAATRRFMSTMLKSAGFYSVEENFSMDFGADPKLTVYADFKVEKGADSLAKQDIVLVNSGSVAVPAVLGAHLKKEGFLLHEPFAAYSPGSGREYRPIYQVTTRKQPEIVDAILGALSIMSDPGRSLDVFASDNNGISLSVKADRYFERDGRRFVITRFDGDPVNYTLFRLLETMGYRVVILDERDDFRKVSEKILSRLKINGTFAQHGVLQKGASSYSLQMSGFKIDDTSLPGGGLFLTDLTFPPIVRDVLNENGVSITAR